MEIQRDQNVASYAVVPLIDASARPSYRDNPTLAAGDVKIVRHTGGAWNVANIGTLPAAISGATKQIMVTLTATELNPDDSQYPIIIQFIDQTATKEWDDQEIIIWVRPKISNLSQILGTAVSTPATAGILDVNVKNMNNVAATSITAINANQGTTQPINFTGTGATAYAKTDMVDIAGSAVSTSTAQIGVNAVNAGGTAWASGSITDAVFASATYPKSIRTATAQSGAAGYIQLDASASATNDLYKGCSIKITSGTGLGQSRTIILYVGATQRAYIDSVWATNPSSDSVFVINSGKLTLDIVNSGVATAGAATTITIASTAVATDNYYNSSQLTIISGTGAGQTRDILSYTGSSRLVTVKTTWAVTPDNTSVYFIRAFGTVESNTVYVGGTLQTAGDLSAQIGAIGSGTGSALNYVVDADNASSPIKTISSVGSQTGTFADTTADDTSNHVLSSATNVIDWIYGFTAGSAKTGTKVTWKGTMSGTGPNSDTFTFQAYRFDTNAWETRLAVANSSAAVQSFTITLLSRNTGSSGVDKGKVYIRVLFSEADAGTLTTNFLLLEASQSGSSVGYSDGAVWLNTNVSNTNVVPYVDGVADNPVSSITSAMTLLVALGMKRIRVANGSSVTLAASIANYSMLGKNWILALGGQAIDGAYFEGAEVSGTGTCTAQAEFIDCTINNSTTVGPSRMIRCGFDMASGSPLSGGSAGEFVFVDCYSEVAAGGTTTPYFTFTGASAVQFRRYSGGANITLDSTSAALTYEVVGGGGLTVALAGADIEVRGIPRDITITGVTSASTVRIDAVTGPISLSGADGAATIYGICATVSDNRTGTPTLTNNALSQITIPDATWDEARSGHTASGSFGEGAASVQGNVTGSVASVTNRVTANMDQIAGSANAATQQSSAANLIIPATVDDTAFSPTATEFECDDITDAETGLYIGRIVIFRSGTLTREAKEITGYSLISGRGHFTVKALTSAPANNVTLLII